MTLSMISRFGGMLFLAIMVAWVGPVANARDEPEPLIVFAASSLAPPLEAIAAAYAEETGNQVRISSASSAVLARQIERGAPAGLFISAHNNWLSHVVDAGRANRENMVIIAGNRLVLATRSNSQYSPSSGLDILKLLGPDERLAVGNPETVPLGIYTREALTARGLWQVAEGKLAEAASARAAVAMVQTGMVPYGILYSSDVHSSGLTALADIPTDSHSPILYRAAPITGRSETAPSSAALAFLEFLGSDTALALLVESGFSVRSAATP